MRFFLRIIAVVFACLFAALASAQTTVVPYLNSTIQLLDNSGAICSGCLLDTFSAGTTTPLATYSESTGTTPNANPIVLNSAGRATVYLTPSSYKFRLRAVDGSTIWTQDGINASTLISTFASIIDNGDLTLQKSTAATSGANQSSNNSKICGNYWIGSASAQDCWLFADILGAGSNPTSTLTVSHSGSSGSATVSWPSMVFNNLTVSGATSTASLAVSGATNLNTLQTSGLATLPGGVCYKYENGQAVVVVSASCGYTTWALALAACPSTGCILDGTPPDVPLAMGAFDTGSNTKPVTVRLGPYSFTATQITVRQGLDFGGSNTLSTNLTSVGTNAQHLFVNPQVNNNAITVKIHDLSINALSGNTSQDGFFFDCSTLTNAGVELSRFDNLIFNGFKGSVLHFKATQDGVSGSIGCFQGNTITNVTAIRPTGATGATQNALRIEGGTGQIDFYNDWVDGQSSDTGQNVFVGTTGTQAPYSIHFHGVTNQNGNAYLFDGCGQCTTDYDHFEVIKGAYNFLATASPTHFTSTNAYINSNVAVNAGNGYIANIPNTAGNVDALVDRPFIGGQPDNCVKNASTTSTARITNIRVIPGNTPVNVCPSNGITGTLTPAATVDLRSWDTVQVTNSATSMTTFKSTKMPGESVALYASGGTIQFATGGNLSLGTQTSPMVVPSGDSATFMRVDAGTPAFVLTALSTKTLTSPVINGTPTGTGIQTVTFKKGTGAGNYSSASTSDVVVDGTNLAATITIPTGWKLSILATGGVASLTATVTVFIGVADGGTVVYTQPVTASGVGNFAPFTLGWEINGDGAAHTVDLRYHTSNGADSVSVNNASSTQLPTITFTLSPSN